MKKVFLIVILLVFLAGSFIGGILYSQRGASNNPVARGKTSDGQSTQADMDGGNPSSIPGAVKITAQRRQMAGVRVGKVEKESQKHTLRTLGRVAANENLTYRIFASTDGWVSDVRGGTTGSLVKKDQLLAKVYNYQFLTREQQYLYALEFEERRQKARAEASKPPSPDSQSAGGPQTKAPQPGAQQTMPSGNIEITAATPGGETNPSGRAVYSIRDQLEVAKLELYSLGVSDYQIREIARTRKLSPDIEIRAPATGLVLNRNVSFEQRFDKGSELFRIADLSRVWIVADVFGREAQYIRPGMSARVYLPEYNRVYKAVVSDVPPQIDPVTRTLKVRLETVNPEFALRPEMFVDVEFSIALPPAVTIPVDALLDSGLKKTVFVDLGNGIFEPREVETGWRFNNRVEIIKGLKPGERIAMSGTFLIDSESRLGLAAAGMAGLLSTDPVSRAEVSMIKAEKAGRMSRFRGKTYYFQSEQTKAHFDQNPARYAEKPAGEPKPGEQTDPARAAENKGPGR